MADHDDTNDAASAATATAGSESSLFVGSVEKVFKVLKAFDNGTRSQPLKQIALNSGLNLSATQRFVYTLQALGYLRKDPQTRQYSLSPKLLNLGTSYLRSEELAGRATPYMRKAADRSQETVSLLELDGTDTIHVIRYGAARLVNMRILLGSRTPALAGAGGRVILALMPSADAAAIVDAALAHHCDPPGLPGRAEIEDGFAATRRDGFLVVQQETAGANVALAAPVLGPGRRPVAAVEFTIPPDRWADPAARDLLIGLALDTAGAISTPG
ncbi:MAG: IclR family transcriptional regulator [Alphaproteobacteria bacterium]